MIETERTPNPDTLKFLPGKTVSEIGPIEFLKNSKNISVPLADKILSMQGITMVFFGEDFVTVKKDKDLNWDDLKHNIISEINHYYSQGNSSIIKKKSKESSTDSKKNDEDEVVNKINEVLDSKVRPAVAKDGGDITFKSFNNGVVTVELKGSCSGCPSSTMTLKQGVQNLLCHYIPEVKSVEAN